MKRLLLSLILCTLFSHTALAEGQQTATVLRQTSLLDAPYSDANILSRISAKQQVTIIKRKGGWYQVKANRQTGWLRMSHIRFGDARQARASGQGLGEIFSFASTGRSGADGVTVATGIRGLDAADVSNAKPNHQAVKKLNQFQSSPKQARTFAKNAQLKSQPLGYFADK